MAPSLTPAAASEPPADAPEEKGPGDIEDLKGAAGPELDAPAAGASSGPDDPELSPVVSTVTALAEPDEAQGPAFDPEPESAAELVEESGSAAEPARRRAPVAAAHAHRGEEHALLPRRGGFTSDPVD